MKRVILNVVKNLKSMSGCTQILRFAQDDTSFMLRVAWLTLCISLSLQSGAQTPFRVMFWNVENLFDTQDDPQKNDNEFLPDAARHWTYPRYRDKLKKIAQTIVASGDECVPDLVGLCEVENDSCLDDLTRRSPLHEAGYRYVMTHSPDRRGIDVALLYQRSTFRLLHHQSIRVSKGAVKRSTPTRDILHVAGKLQSGDTLDVMVCHLPSRSGGKARTEPFRMVVADIIARTADSLVQVRQHPYLIVMGDFNDYPTDKSLKRLCSGNGLQNLMKGKKGGTYRYRGEWGILDQFIVSGSLLKKKSHIRTSKAKAHILRHPFLLEEDDKFGGEKPFRTFNGMKYQGGFSDHLPISLDLTIRD